jgi:cytochrome c-type biogenesis protein CcmH
VLLVLVVVGFLAVGSTRDAGPRTPDERLEDISSRLACPICDGESVFESRNSDSEAIRTEIKAQIAQSNLSDTQIITYISDRYGARVLLVPKASGIDALVWALPVAALVCAVIGLIFAFRRWRLAADTVPDDADRALVAAAMADDARADRGDDREDHDEAGA